MRILINESERWETALAGTEDHLWKTSHWPDQQIEDSGFHLPPPHFEREGQHNKRDREREIWIQKEERAPCDTPSLP